MIDKEYGRYHVVCDVCGTELDDIYDSFQEALDSMRAHRWKTVKLGQDWINCCPKCGQMADCPTASEFAGL